MDWEQRATEAEARVYELELENEDLTDKLGLANNDLEELKRQHERLLDMLHDIRCIVEKL